MAVFNFKNASFSSLILLRALNYNSTTRWCARAQDCYLDKNLLARKLPNELKKKLVKDQLISSLIFFNNPSKRKEILFSRVLKEKFSGADAIYTNFINDDIELIKKAKEYGLEIIHEVIITPSSGLNRENL